MKGTSDAVIYHGDAIKALGDGKIGGYLVRFSTEKDPDLHGEFFTKSTYFGPRDGDGADMLFHHGIPVKSGLEQLADHIFKPIKTRKDEIGIFAEAALDMANAYEAAVYQLAQAGKLGWSSGTAKYLVKTTDAGEITRWPIIEGSLTPTPAEPRNRARAIKSLDELLSDAAITHDEIDEIKSVRELEQRLCDRGIPKVSKEKASHLISRLKAALSLGDPDELAEAKAQIKKLEGELLEVRTANLRLRLNLPHN